jgi:hypothetical protein
MIRAAAVTNFGIPFGHPELVEGSVQIFGKREGRLN